MQQEILFFEVVSDKGSWRGSYSPQLDKMPNRASAREQALYNAKIYGGSVWEVYQDQPNIQIWPPISN